MRAYRPGIREVKPVDGESWRKLSCAKEGQRTEDAYAAKIVQDPTWGFRV